METDEEMLRQIERDEMYVGLKHELKKEFQWDFIGIILVVFIMVTLSTLLFGSMTIYLSQQTAIALAMYERSCPDIYDPAGPDPRIPMCYNGHRICVLPAFRSTVFANGGCLYEGSCGGECKAIL